MPLKSLQLNQYILKLHKLDFYVYPGFVLNISQWNKSLQTADSLNISICTFLILMWTIKIHDAMNLLNQIVYKPKSNI